MSRVLFAITAAFFLFQASVVQAQSNLKIEGTIQSQIDAFLMDDFDAAFAFAAPSIKQIFGSSERFGQMVKQGFPMVHRPSNVQFLELREIAGSVWQKVLITDQKGVFYTLDYKMVPAGQAWQIGGVQILPNPEVGV